MLGRSVRSPIRCSFRGGEVRRLAATSLAVRAAPGNNVSEVDNEACTHIDDGGRDGRVARGGLGVLRW